MRLLHKAILVWWNYKSNTILTGNSIDFFQVFRRNLLPTVITDYWRAPYVSDYDSNFRLTFDSLISVKKSSKLFNNLNNFERKCLAGYSILEIKFNRRIPKWFHRIIQNYNLRRISVSKYYER